MFSGIVTGIGRIVGVERLGPTAAYGVRVAVESPFGFLTGARVGDSIALSGACMTVTALDPAAPERFTVEVSAESLARTHGLDRDGRRVNLERALRASDRLDGHLASGHVDGVGRVAVVETVGESTRLSVDAPPELAPFLARKGSIAVDGVSLTVNTVEDREGTCRFAVNVIAHTASVTTLGALASGDAVHLEVDTVARYVERMLGLADNRSA